MKKRLVCLLCTLLMLTAASCTRMVQTTSKTDVSSSGTASQTETGTSSTAATASQTETYTMEAFIAAIQDQIDSAKASLANSGLGMDVIARDNALVYQYRYQKKIEDVSAAKASLETAIASQDVVFQNVLNQVRAVVPDAKSVIVEYFNTDGSLIFSKEYK